MLKNFYKEYLERNHISEKNGKVVTSDGVELTLSPKGQYIDLIKIIDIKGQKIRFGGQIIICEDNPNMIYLTPELPGGGYQSSSKIEDLIDTFLKL